MFVTERGAPTHVLLTIESYRALTGQEISIAQALAQKADRGDFDFDPPPVREFSLRIPEFDDE